MRFHGYDGATASKLAAFGIENEAGESKGHEPPRFGQMRHNQEKNKLILSPGQCVGNAFAGEWIYARGIRIWHRNLIRTRDHMH